MNDAFAQVIAGPVQYVLDFQQRVADGEQPGLDEVKGRLVELIDRAEQEAAVTRELAADFALAKYALVYWIDEVLINSRWSHADQWRNYILEWEYFRTNLAGVNFFEKAEQAERLQGTDPLETFYLCVALGFLGQLGLNKPELRRWAERAYARVAGASTQPDRFLPDEPRDATCGPLRPLPGKSLLLTVSVLVSATALVTLVCFILAVQAASG